MAIRGLLGLIRIPPPLGRSARVVRGIGEGGIGLLPACLSCRLGIRLYPPSDRPRWMHIAGIPECAMTASHLPTKALQYLLGSDIAIFALTVRRVVEDIDEVIRNL